MDFVKAQIWQFQTFLILHYITCWQGVGSALVSQGQIKSVNITLLACFPHASDSFTALVKSVPEHITQQLAELLRDRTGFTSTCPAIHTQLVNTALGQSS